MTRKAGDIWNKAKEFYSSDFGQDIIETSMKASAAAGAQAALTDMTPEEIALATTAGATAAMLARPVGKRVGNYIGRRMDNYANQGFDTPMKSTYEMANEYVEQAKKHVEKYPIARESLDVMQRRLLTNYADGSGKMRGDMEGALGELLREVSDDAAQGSLAFIFPTLFNTPEETTDTLK